MAQKYYYDTGEEKIGPVTGNDLVRLRAEGEIDNQTWVRRAESDTWRPLGGINLKAEEEEEANPSLLKLFLRSGSCWTVALYAIAILVAAGIILYYAWPLLLGLIVMFLIFQLVGKAK